MDEPSEIDEAELERRMEEELANYRYVPDENDLETQSVYSIQSARGNLDDYLEKMLEREREKNKELSTD